MLDNGSKSSNIRIMVSEVWTASGHEVSVRFIGTIMGRESFFCMFHLSSLRQMCIIQYIEKLNALGKECV